MTFLVDGNRIEVRAVYSWFNVYVNYTLLLKHISKEDANDIVNAIKKANGTKIAEETEPMTEEQIHELIEQENPEIKQRIWEKVQQKLKEQSND